MQPPTFRAAPKSGDQEARTTQGAAERAVAALGRKGRGGEGFSFLPLRKRKPRLPIPDPRSKSRFTVLSRKVSK